MLRNHANLPWLVPVGKRARTAGCAFSLNSNPAGAGGGGWGEAADGGSGGVSSLPL